MAVPISRQRFTKALLMTLSVTLSMGSRGDTPGVDAEVSVAMTVSGSRAQGEGHNPILVDGEAGFRMNQDGGVDLLDDRGSHERRTGREELAAVDGRPHEPGLDEGD